MASRTLTEYRTGFPFLFYTSPAPASVEPDADTEADRNRMELTLVEMAKIYWRVKQWKISYSLTVTNGGSHTFTVTDEPFTDVITHADENDLLVNPGLSFTTASAGDDSSSLFLGGFNGGRVKSGGVFSLVSEIAGVNYYEETVSPYTVFNMDFSTRRSTYASPVTGAISVTIAGKNFPTMTIYSGYSTQLPTGTLTLTPLKYWTYGGVYDEDTGLPV